MPSTNVSIGYYLRGDIWYAARERGSELVFSLAKHIAKEEKRGKSLEFVAIYPTGSDWAGCVLMQER